MSEQAKAAKRERVDWDAINARSESVLSTSYRWIEGALESRRIGERAWTEVECEVEMKTPREAATYVLGRVHQADGDEVAL